MKLKIKKGSTVEVIAGSDKGKKGAVLHLDPVSLKVRVQGVRMQTHFSKEDGLQQKEGLIDYSNLKLVSGPAAKKKAKKKTASRKTT